MQKMHPPNKIIAIQSTEVREAEALLGIFFVSNFSSFLFQALLGLFCKHFFLNFSLFD